MIDQLYSKIDVSVKNKCFYDVYRAYLFSYDRVKATMLRILKLNLDTRFYRNQKILMNEQYHKILNMDVKNQ